MKNAILIATFNEAENIRFLLEQLRDYDVFIVDDNSPDGTAKIAKEFNNVEVLVRKDKRGIASAYIDGFKWILKNEKSYDSIVQMDAGLTHEPKDIFGMIKSFQENDYDLLIGSRNIKEQKIISYRTLISKMAILLLSLIGVNQNDVTSGFRVWDVELLKKIDFDKILSKGFSFQFELLFYALKYHDANVGEYKIQYKLTNSSFNFKILREAFVIWTKLVVKNLVK